MNFKFLKVHTPCPVPIEVGAGLFMNIASHTLQGNSVSSLIQYNSLLKTPRTRTPPMASFRSQSSATVRWRQGRGLSECCWTVLNYLWCLLPTCIKTFILLDESRIFALLTSNLNLVPSSPSCCWESDVTEIQMFSYKIKLYLQHYIMYKIQLQVTYNNEPLLSNFL